MSLFRPRKPSKPGAKLSIWEMLFNGNGLFGSDSNGKWEYKSGVYFYKPNFPSSSGGGGKGGSGTFRGEYDPTASYAAQDTVVIRAGSNSGSFVCIAANSGSAPQLPDTGNLYWVSLSGNVPSGGNWMT